MYTLQDLWVICYVILATSFICDFIAPFGQKAKEIKKKTFVGVNTLCKRKTYYSKTPNSKQLKQIL